MIEYETIHDALRAWGRSRSGSWRLTVGHVRSAPLHRPPSWRAYTRPCCSCAGAGFTRDAHTGERLQCLHCGGRGRYSGLGPVVDPASIKGRDVCTVRATPSPTLAALDRAIAGLPVLLKAVIYSRYLLATHGSKAERLRRANLILDGARLDQTLFSAALRDARDRLAGLVD